MRSANEASPLPPEPAGEDDVMPPGDDTRPGPEGSPLPPDPEPREDILRPEPPGS